MPFTGIRLLSLCCALGMACFGASGAVAEDHAAVVRQALVDRDHWLGQGANAEAWREYLLDKQLKAQLERSGAADVMAVAAVYARYRGGAEGLGWGPFVRVREGLKGWLETLPAGAADQLSGMARASAKVFLPYSAEDVQGAKAALRGAVERLQTRLASYGAEGERWRDYLMLSRLEQELARPQGADLDEVFRRFTAGYEGLQLTAFADVRTALRRYLATSRALGQPQLRQQYQKLLENLATSLEKHRSKPTLQTANEVNVVLEWLEQSGQAPWLAAAIRQRMSHPNLFLSVSGELVASRIGGPVQDTSAVRDCILGTDIHGTALANGQVKVELVPSPDRAIIDILFQGTINTNSVGYNGPATIQSTGNTLLAVRKRLVFENERFLAMPAASSAVTSSNIHCIEAKLQLIERIAWKKAGQQQPEANTIASRHAEQRFNDRMDRQADPLVSRLNQDYAEKFRRPLADRNLVPSLFRISTTRSSLELVVQEEGGNLAAPASPRALAEPADIARRVHESAINNLAEEALGGVMLDEKRFQEIITRYFDLPERIQTAADEQEWSITFPERQPVQVVFAENGFSITISGRRYVSEGRDYPGMNVTGVYKIEKGPRGLAPCVRESCRFCPPASSPMGASSYRVASRFWSTCSSRGSNGS